jgi:chromosome segregation ATPase
MNETSARYVNAMIRKPNARRNEDLARALSVARDTGSGSTQNLSRIIEAVREKPSTDGATVAMLNKLMRAKTSGNSDALRRAMKEIEDLKRTTPVTNRVNDKQKKIAELEKYVVNKGGKLNTQRRVAFMNDAQKSIKAYKNGTNMYNTAKTRITAAYETAYKANLNNMGPKKAIDALQKTVNTIGNSKIKTSAREKLNVFIQSGGTDTSSKNAVIKLKKLDEELKLRKNDVNRDYLNEMRDEALKNINSYNIKNGLAKINRRVQEDMKKRGVEFNTMIANDMYKNVPSNVKTTLRNKYVSGKLNSNDVKRGLNNAVETSAGVFKGLENKIANLETKLENSKLTANERNALKKELNKSRQRRNTNAKNMNVMREQLGNMKTNINTKARNIEKLKNELAKSASPNVRNKLKSNLNLALKNQYQTQKEYQALQTEKIRKNALYKKLKNEKENANAQIQSLRNKLNTNKSLSNGEKTALQEQLNNAMKNRTNLNNRLRKSEAEKMQYMREMNALAENVRKQKENANDEIKKLKNKLNTNKSLSNGEKTALQEQLNNAMKNRTNLNNRLRKSEAEKMQYMREMNTLAGNVRNITKQKENANDEIKKLKNKLNTNKSLSNGEKRALQEQLNNAMKNRANVNNRLRKSEAEKMQYMREMSALAENVRNKNEEINQIKKNMAAAGTLSMTQKKKLRQNLENAQSEREKLRSNATKAELERNNLKAESNKRQRALKEAAEKEAEITKKLGESNASIKNLTEQRAKLLEKGELNAAEKAKLERIRKKLTDERNAKNNEIRLLQTLSKNRENALEKISTKLNEATRSLTRSEGLISTQKESLEAKNKNLKARQNQVGNLYTQIKTLTTQATQANEEIKQQTAKLATSASEINRLQKQLTNATEARTRNINNMQMRHAENIRAATAQIQELTKNVQERNANIQRSKVTGQWKGAAVRGLGTQLKNTRTNLTRAQKEIGVARTAVNGLRGQRNKLQKQLKDTKKILGNTQNNLRQTATTLNSTRLQMQGRIRGMTQGQKRTQAQLNQARQSARTYKAAARRNVGSQFNATGMFQQMGNKLAANRNAWKRAGGRWQGAKSGVKAQENLRVAKNALRTIINSHRKNGNWTIGGPVGWKRQTLRYKVNTATDMNQIKEARRLVAAAKKEKNFKIGQGKMDPVLAKAGTGFSFGNRGPPMTMNQRLA